jgi:hypothetical protein
MRLRRDHVPAAVVATAFTLLTIGFTWPLARHLTTAVPGDYGDAVFVTSVMGWVAAQLTQVLGDPSTLETFWNLNIFYPELGALAFSDNYITQTVSALPIYWLTGNLLLTHNVAFFLSFVLTGLATFLLIQSLTGSPMAALFGAMVVTFNEYRLRFEVMHIQLLSIQWFPFALLALKRYVESDRRRWLVLAAGALVALNLASTYYMAFCSPFVVLFTLFVVLQSGRWREPRVWLELWATAAAVLVAMAPFLLPYFAMQQRFAIVPNPQEVIAYSLTLDSYRSALPWLAIPLAFAVVALAGAAFRRSTPGRLAVLTFTLLLGLSFWLSLGPVIRSGEHTFAWPGLFGLLQAYVPGFGGLRAPSRYAMLFLFFLGVLAAYGVATIQRRSLRAAGVSVVVGLIVLLFTTPAGIPINQPIPSVAGLPLPPVYLTPSPTLPAIYRAVDQLPPEAVIAEFPFGDMVYEIRYMYFAAMHRRRLLNGYSSIFPPSYLARQRVLARPTLDPERAAQALDGATHVVVHRQAWTDDSGAAIGRWLGGLSARIVAESDGAALYELPVREGLALGESIF